MRTPSIDPSVNVLTARLAKAQTLKLMEYPRSGDPLRLVAFWCDDVLGFASGVVSTVETAQEWR